MLTKDEVYDAMNDIGDLANPGGKWRDKPVTVINENSAKTAMVALEHYLESLERDDD